MTASSIITGYNQFVDSACEGELYESFEFTPEDHFETDVSGGQAISMLTIRDIDWDEAYIRFGHLAYISDKESVMAWKLIRDMLYIKDLSFAIENKEESVHWLDLYRQHRPKLERIIDTYSQDPEYDILNKIFDVANSAGYLLEELMLEQTHPIASAQFNPDIDEYNGIHYEPEEKEYINLPDTVVIDGIEIHPKQFAQADGAWSEDLIEYEELYYDTDLEGELPSAPISQMNENELHVTGEYFRLQYQYTPLMLEINRQISRIENNPLLKIANEENKPFVQEMIDHQLREFESSRLIRALQKALRLEYQQGTPAQDIAGFVMFLPFDITINGQISSVIDQFGDDILDSIVEPAGVYEQNEAKWESFMDRFHLRTLDMLAKTANAHSPKLHAKFVTEAFKAVAERQLPIKEVYAQAYETFRELSPSGLSAFRQAIVDDKSPQKAMHEFYETAQKSGEYIARDRLLSANANRILVLTASSGFTQERELNWRLASYKAKQGEIYVPKNSPGESKARLLDLLLSKGWNRNQVAKLSE